jgi:hypothetical protein
MYMKNSILFLCLGILFVCCKNDPKDTVDTQKELHTTKQGPLSMQESIANLDGTWIADDYMAAIEKNKSIYNNPAYTTSLFGFSVIADSLAIDGRDYLFGFSKIDAGYTWPIFYNNSTGRFEYDVKMQDEIIPPSPFYIKTIDATTVELVFSKPAKTERYRKADLESDINKILFAGTYTDQATNEKVTFTEDGKVTGLPGKVMYYVQFENDDEFAVPFDAVDLFDKPDDEAGEPFHYKIKGNTLTLYKINQEETENDSEYKYTIGPKAYTLIKN